MKEWKMEDDVQCERNNVSKSILMLLSSHVIALSTQYKASKQAAHEQRCILHYNFFNSLTHFIIM